jgi:hypothetical protein
LPNTNQLKFPSIEELRMLRAIAMIAVAYAACLGEYRASFRGYRVHAWRIGPVATGSIAHVRMETRYGAVIMERRIVDIAI